MNSSGGHDEIHIFDWTGPLYDVLDVNTPMITNADTGVLFTFAHEDIGGTVGYSMAVTTGTSVSVMSASQLPTNGGNVEPVLQAQDGSFIGTTGDGEDNSMVAFEATGNGRWTVPGYGPKIATADGGVIAQAYDPETEDFAGPAVTFDQNGNATGQMASLPTYSWVWNAYQVGSVDQVVAMVPYIATSFWAFAMANDSENGTAARPKYAPLKSCPGAATPCPQEAIMSALSQLKALLQSPCQACQDSVFSKLSGTDQASFLKYLSLPPRFWDATRSYAPADEALCATDWQHFFGFFCAWGGVPVHDFMGDADAKSQTPSNTGKGVQIFFKPATAICNVLSLQAPGVGDQGVLNQALLLHEALHGYTGKDDNYLESSFPGVPVTIGESANVTNYLKNNVIPGGAQGATTCRN